MMIYSGSKIKGVPSLFVLTWKIRTRNRVNVQRSCAILKFSPSPVYWLAYCLACVPGCNPLVFCYTQALTWSLDLEWEEGGLMGRKRERFFVHLELRVLRLWRNQKLIKNDQSASQTLMGLHRVPGYTYRPLESSTSPCPILTLLYLSSPPAHSPPIQYLMGEGRTVNSPGGTML